MQPCMPTSCNSSITASHKTLHKYCSAKKLLPIIQIMTMHLCVYWCLLHFKMQGRMWTRKFHGCSILTHSLRTPGVHIFVPYLREEILFPFYHGIKFILCSSVVTLWCLFFYQKLLADAIVTTNWWRKLWIFWWTEPEEWLWQSAPGMIMWD
jgi:hypothetical protein